MRRLSHSAICYPKDAAGLLLIEAGLSPMEAIQSTASHPSSLVRSMREVGTIQLGKWADLIAAAGDMEAIDWQSPELAFRDP
jgi:imidazolonepropionase-like amidohydrolase